MDYNCECCNYKTDKRFNYEKHLASKKHRIVEENIRKQQESTQSQHLVNPKSTQVATFVATHVTCKYCEKQFKFKQSMYRHIKYTCTKNKDEDLKELVRLMNIQI